MKSYVGINRTDDLLRCAYDICRQIQDETFHATIYSIVVDAENDLTTLKSSVDWLEANAKNSSVVGETDGNGVFSWVDWFRLNFNL